MEINSAIVRISSRIEDFKDSELDIALRDKIFLQDINISVCGIRKARYSIILNLDTPEKVKYYEERIKPLLIEDRRDGKLYHNTYY